MFLIRSNGERYESLRSAPPNLVGKIFQDIYADSKIFLLSASKYLSQGYKKRRKSEVQRGTLLPLLCHTDLVGGRIRQAARISEARMLSTEKIHVVAVGTRRWPFLNIGRYYLVFTM